MMKKTCLKLDLWLLQEIRNLNPIKLDKNFHQAAKVNLKLKRKVLKFNRLEGIHKVQRTPNLLKKITILKDSKKNQANRKNPKITNRKLNVYHFKLVNFLLTLTSKSLKTFWSMKQLGIHLDYWLLLNIVNRFSEDNPQTHKQSRLSLTIGW